MTNRGPVQSTCARYCQRPSVKAVGVCSDLRFTEYASSQCFLSPQWDDYSETVGVQLFPGRKRDLQSANSPDRMLLHSQCRESTCQHAWARVFRPTYPRP